MFNVGGMELLVIGVLALIVLGPDKLPKAIRQIGQVVGELRRISSGFQTDLRGALEEAEREADAAQRAANRAAPDPATPNPAAATAAAHAELAAAEAALEDAEASANGRGSEGPAGASVSSTDDEDPSDAAS